METVPKQENFLEQLLTTPKGGELHFFQEQRKNYESSIDATLKEFKKGCPIAFQKMRIARNFFVEARHMTSKQLGLEQKACSKYNRVKDHFIKKGLIPKLGLPNIKRLEDRENTSKLLKELGIPILKDEQPRHGAQMKALQSQLK